MFRAEWTAPAGISSSSLTYENLGCFPRPVASILAWVQRFRLPGDRPMSSPRYPGRDLRLERLGDRDGLRPAHLGEAAQVRSLPGAASSAREVLAAYQALIDAVVTAPGATEWLFVLRRKVAGI